MQIRLKDASDFCDALMESMSAWRPSESRPDEGVPGDHAGKPFPVSVPS